MKFFNNFILWNDAPEPWQIVFQDSSTRSMEGIDRLNGFIYYYEIILLVLIGWLFISIFVKYVGQLISYKYNNHSTALEILWTCTPGLILISIAFPSFRLIYLTDEITESNITIKVIGFLLGGLTLYILNKIKDTYYNNQVVLCLLNIGEKNNISNNSLIESFFILFNIPNIRANKRIGPHNKQVISIIIGSLLNSPKLEKFINSNKKNISTIQTIIDPNWITGFADAESSFIISIYKSNNRKINWRVTPIFSISLHSRDLQLLDNIKIFFKTGNIIKIKNNQLNYSVKSIKDITNVIIPHFDKYPLLTQKKADFLFFKEAVELINNKEHLTTQGLNKILAIRASMNNGLTEELKISFPNIIPIERPIIKNINQINPNWLVGFVDGEGCFFIHIFKDKTKIGFSTQLRFTITQHSRDYNLMENIIKLLECGYIYKKVNESILEITIVKFSDIIKFIIPFFEKYPLQSNKILDFLDFCKIVNIMKTKEHLTEEGLQQIIYIKSGMNTKRLKIIYNKNITCNLVKKEEILKSNSIFKIQKRSFHNNVKGTKKIGPHNLSVVSIIIGSLLGKAICKKIPEGVRIYFKQTVVHKDYIFWLHEFFYNNGYCTNLLPRKYTRKLKRNNEIKEYFGYEFNTFSFRSFNWIHKMFYNKGTKVFKIELEKYIDPLALAIWCMFSAKYINERIELSTNFKRYQDIENLIKMLNNKFSLICNIYKDKKDFYVIIISKESEKLLQTIVLSYILPTMRYKINLYKNFMYSSPSSFDDRGLLLKNKKENRFYSTLNNSKTNILNPYYITGFSDGESNFSIIITKNKSLKIGWRIQPCFQINLHKKDINLLNKIKNYFGVGNIYEQKNSYIYIIKSFKDLSVVIKHFDLYPLLTKKQADFKLFKKIFNLIKNDEHKTLEGLLNIISIRASINLGLSEQLKIEFPNIIPIERPIVMDQKIKDPHWLAGFIDGESSFDIRIQKNSKSKIGSAVSLRFRITQNIIDKRLMESFIKYLDCGSIQKTSNCINYEVVKFFDINTKIIPFLVKYPILGSKLKDFLDFYKAASIIEKKRHLTKEGLEQIIIIKKGMNRNRIEI